MGRKALKPQEIESRIGTNNPLVGESFKIIVRKMIEGGKYRQDGDVLIPLEVEVEKEDYVKVYVKPENRKIINALTDTSKRLYIWIMYNIEHGSDWIWINKKLFMSEVHISSLNTYKKAVEELARYNLIHFTAIKDVFWINPRLFFAGSRVNKYPKNVEYYEPKKEK